MNTNKATLLLLVALCLAPAAPALGQEGHAPEAIADSNAEAVTIPFAPPVGTPVRYALRFERKRPGGGSTIDFEQQLTFEREDTGYTLRLETLSFTTNNQRFDLADKRVLDAMPTPLRVYLLPLTVELDSAGEMVRMRNWEALREQLRQFPEVAARMSGAPVDPAAVAAAAQVLDPIINSSAEDAPAIVIRGWPAVLGYGGAEFVPGETVEADTEMTGGIFSEPIPATMKGSLIRTPSGSLQLVQNAVIDPAVLREALLAMLRQLRAHDGARGAPDPADDISTIAMTDDTEIEFDAVTGLPITARTARLSRIGKGAGIEPEAVGEVMTIRRMYP